MDKAVFISLLGAVIGVVGIAVNCSVRYVARISWRSVRRAIMKLEPHLRKYDPDILIALADGGVVTGIIATNFRTSTEGGRCFHPYCTLGVHVADSADGGKRVTLLGPDSVGDLTGKRVLVVDNHLYTGETLRLAVEFLRTKQPLEIRTLVLFKLKLEEQLCVPTYFAYSIRKRRKRVPWSYTRKHEAVYGT